MKIKQNLKDVGNLIGIVQRKNRLVVLLLIIGPFTGAMMPFLLLLFSSRSLEYVIKGQYTLAVPEIIYLLGSQLVFGIVSKACRQSFSTIVEVADETVEQQTIAKSYRIQYAKLEQTKTMDAFRRVREGTMGSGGVEDQLNTIYLLVKNLWTTVFSLGFVITLLVRGREGQRNFWTSYGSTILLIGVYAIILCVCARLTKVSQKKVNQMRKDNEHFNSTSAYMSNLIMNKEHGKDIRLYSMKQYLINLYEDYLHKGVGMYLNWGETDGRYSAFTSFLTNLAAGTAYVVLTTKAIYGVISMGDVFLYAGAVNQLGNAVQTVINEYILMEYRMDYLKLYVEFIKQSDMNYDGTLPIEKRDDAQYELEFQDVSFRYPETEELILNHVNLKFEVGEKLAIVGRNGAGKSTLIKLLCRLYEPTEGKILLNGIDISYYDYEEYVKIFAVVFQEHKVFSFPLGENLSGSEVVNEQKAWDALEQVGLKERVEAMPDGLKSQLYLNNGEGIEISGGEAQKIAIARALYKDAPFVILDEPAAALDPYSEAEIYEHFDELVHGKTAIYISHRMSSCKFCGRILVMNQGTVAESGTHESLMEQGGIYAQLYQTQAQYYENAV